jgi:hypothetical protein
MSFSLSSLGLIALLTLSRQNSNSDLYGQETHRPYCHTVKKRLSRLLSNVGHGPRDLPTSCDGVQTIEIFLLCFTTYYLSTFSSSRLMWGEKQGVYLLFAAMRIRPSDLPSSKILVHGKLEQ